jgi:hypothetical protein
LEELELFELGSLIERLALLIKGAINELCFHGVVSTIGLLEFSRGVELLGWAAEGRGRVLGREKLMEEDE